MVTSVVVDTNGDNVKKNQGNPTSLHGQLSLPRFLSNTASSSLKAKCYSVDCRIQVENRVRLTLGVLACFLSSSKRIRRSCLVNNGSYRLLTGINARAETELTFGVAPILHYPFPIFHIFKLFNLSYKYIIK